MNPKKFSTTAFSAQLPYLAFNPLVKQWSVKIKPMVSEPGGETLNLRRFHFTLNKLRLEFQS